jgi:hypothetical protein
MISWCAKHIETALQSSFEDHNAQVLRDMEARRLTGAVLADEEGSGYGNDNDAVVVVVKPSGEAETSDEEDHIKASAYEHCLVEHLR